jgi:hypothetical protein
MFRPSVSSWRMCRELSLPRSSRSLYFFSLALVFSSRRPLERVHYYLATALTPYEAGTFVTSKPARWSRSITPRKTLSRAFGSPT